MGPNASAVGPNATSSPGGVGSTNGLNPGSPSANINLHIPNTGNVFDIPNIDISIDFRRNESTAQMIKRGVFTFNQSSTIGSFKVVFRVNDGTGGTVVTSTAYPIPQDATFRNYRFTYDNCSGIGTMYVNNVTVWSSPTPTVNQNLYWVSDGDIIIGQDMDGAGNNIVNLDNFLLQPFSCSILPINLLSFTGYNSGQKNNFKWSTGTEKNNDYFSLEKSVDGQFWQPVAKVVGAGNSSTLKTYTAEDKDPGTTLNYYRLKQTDHNGSEKTFTIISIDNSKDAARVVKITDSLGREMSEDFVGLRFVFYSDGTVLRLVN